MLELLLQSLSSGLSLWKHKDARKYLDRVIELQRELYDEYNKDRPDNAVLDDIQFELRNITKSFASQVAPKNSLPE